jgi:hypothetical protein
MMHGSEKSDPVIVAGKPSMHWTQSQGRVSQAHLPSHTRGGSRMRESRTYGSVRGARGNSRPYREGALLPRTKSGDGI